MKKIQKHIIISRLRILLLILLPFILSNCEEELKDFKLNSSEPKIVIDATCSSFSDSAIVKLSKTADYMNPIEFPTISGAIITLQFNDTTLKLTEEEPGTYINTFDFPENTEYHLSVTIDGKTYTAVSFMPNQVPITKLSSKVSDYSRYMETYPGEIFYSPKMEFLDPQHIENYYRIKISKNDSLFNSANDLLITDDIYFNADTINYEPFYFFKSNDTVLIEFQSIDKANYLYYTTLLQAMNSSGSFSVPDNPTTNLSGDVLGHFIAYSSDTIQFIIP